MWVSDGVLERSCNTIAKIFRDHMLQCIGFLMYLIPGIPQGLGQEGFDQPMSANELKRFSLASFRKDDTTITTILNQLGLV
jgi:hypothetical protein